MSIESAQASAQTEPAPEDRRISFERLRERTDELELILSGLFAFALLATPSWLFSRWAEASAHFTGAWEMALTLCFMLGSGLCYALGFFFLVHLCVRGYWVSLIGLKASFSRGIQWDSVGTMGPVASEYYRRRLPDLLHSIDRADRTGSTLFAIATLIAIMLGWIALIMLVVILVGALLGLLIGSSERGIQLVYVVFMGAVLGSATLLFLIDAVLIKRRPHLQHNAPLRRLLHLLLGFYSFIIPQRLIMPVQLTLQSNLPSWVFIAFITLAMALAPLLGTLQLVQSRVFAAGAGYDYLDTDDVTLGMRSAHYESLRGERDQLLRLPMIPSDLIDASHLRLFLPFLPHLDQELLDQRCPDTRAGIEDKADRTDRRIACIASLWQVSLNGAPVAIEGFLPSERRDLGLRGLQGYLDTDRLVPGRQDLFVIWHPEGEASGPQRRREYRIPFWFSPAFEASLDSPPAPKPSPPSPSEPGQP